jgi:uncharacterized protein (DUF169 family)
MQSTLAEALRLKHPPVAVIAADEKPEGGVQFKEGRFGCVGSMLVQASNGRTAIFDRKTFGCPGGGVGLGLGNWYEGFPIEQLLSTGGKAELPGGHVMDMGEGERFFDCPETTRKWVREMPLRDLPSEYVVFKPLSEVPDPPAGMLVVFFANPDQLSALVTLIGYRRGTVENATAPWGAACQSILFGYAEAGREQPRGVIGFFDISQRHRIERDILTLTVPYPLLQEMEANAADSFLRTEAWQKLLERQ